MDEAAVKAAWQSSWKPARRADGEPVDIVITHSFVFRPRHDRASEVPD
jgi:hypothetical protein